MSVSTVVVATLYGLTRKGQSDPQQPVGRWWGSSSVIGDGSGGTLQCDISIPTPSYVFSIDGLSIRWQASGTEQAVLQVNAAPIFPGQAQGLTNWYAGVLLQADSPVGTTGILRGDFNPLSNLPAFWFSRPAPTPSLIRLAGRNDAVFTGVDFMAGGYLWDISCMQHGGPHVPRR